MKKMISFSKNFKVNKLNKGMTYVELIVVLSIFSIMTSIVLFNYNEFQAKVDIKVLSNDIALKIVEAQKSASSGKLPIQTVSTTWAPSYGIYFNTSGTIQSADSKNFIYFANTIDSLNHDYNDLSCSLPPTTSSGECLEKFNITKGSSISRLDVFYQDGTSTVSPASPPTDFTVTFTRPNSGANIKSTFSFTSAISYIQVTISSSRTSSIKSYIKIYPSGRIQIN